MERNFQGDLAEIFQPGVSDHWNNNYYYYFDQSDQETQKIQKSTRIIHDQGFGQPFTSLLADPLIHEGASSSSSTSLFGTTRLLPMEFDGHNNNQNHDNNNNNNNIFSKMLQISPNAANSSLSSSSEIITSSSNSSSSKRCLPEASTSSLQISSPRNPGIKRRKNQTKKVVCIPAPTLANSRSTGEVVPSDPWAWRKYGQKPIKGSPYPRGYYRCSNSKGCLARKQVERSRTDPNMLVITYTSEHNHPWPTQRNALAGSTRTPQKPKTATNEQPPQKETIKDEGPPLRESVVQVKQVLEGSFRQGYRPEFPKHQRGHEQQEGYFSGLDDIEVDPINMLLNNGFLGGGEEQQNYNKGLDPFG